MKKHDWSNYLNFLREIHLSIWTSRNWVGKIIYSPIWLGLGLAAIFFGLGEVCECLYSATTKKP